MISEIVHLDEDTSEEDVLKELDRLNNDDSVSGILVQVPLPKQVSEQKILEAINPEKTLMASTLQISVSYILMSKLLFHVHH